MDMLTQLRDPIVYAIPAFALFIVLEMLSFLLLDQDRFAEEYETRDCLTSVLMGLVSVVINVAARAGVLFVYAAIYVHAPVKFDTNSWLTWLLAFVVVDLVWYIYHRMSHEVRILWAAHQAHHNSRYLNYFTALRQKWNPWFELFLWLPLPLLGLPVWVVFTTFSFNLIFQFFLHTERIDRLPRWVEFVFNTPSHHRVHHGSDPDYLNKNYGGILIIWDRMFGSFREETHQATYGLVENIDSYNLLTLQFHEYGSVIRDVRRATRLRDRLGYLFGPPGWAPHGVSPPSKSDSSRWPLAHGRPG
ncbi:sterol desaturase family protein [Nocardia gipuzkoensis]